MNMRRNLDNYLPVLAGQNSISGKDDGFTLVELMLALVVSSILIAALYSAYLSQQRSQTAQAQVVEMQQNARAALEMLSAEVRMAGFDPRGSSGAGIVMATRGRLQFTRDMNDNGPGTVSGNGNTTDPNENVTYGIANLFDADHDGVVDVGVAPLGRNTGAGFMPVAENVEMIEFLYLVGDELTPTLTPDSTRLNEIRAVTISVLVRAGAPDPRYSSSGTYTMASGAVRNVNDHFRRRLHTTTVQLRNMGLL
jgi:type IV pilus assembly protein PilW